MTTRLPEPGEMFAGKHKLNAVLGEGGFGRVYRATRVDIGRVDAIKVLRPDRSSSTDSARFLREARLLSHLKDPHTVTLHDFGQTEDGMLYMVFEYVEGSTLAEVLKRRRTLDAEVTEHIVRQLLASLTEAHEAGVVHRDIKPANIMIHAVRDDPYAVKLLDFGIAKSFSDPNAIEVTADHQVVGSARYMSPEQFFGESTGPASDLYSLGLVAFEMVVGRPAFDQDDLSAARRAQTSEHSVTLPVELELPANVRTLINRCLQKDEAARPRAVAEALAILDAAPPPVSASEDDATELEREPEADSGGARWPAGSVPFIAASVCTVVASLVVWSVGRSSSRGTAVDIGKMRASASEAALIRDTPNAVDGGGVIDAATIDAPGSPHVAADITLLVGEPVTLPRDDVEKISIDRAAVLDVQERRGGLVFVGKSAGRALVDVFAGDERERIVVDVVEPTDSDVAEHPVITLFTGASLEFDASSIRSITIGKTGTVRAAPNEAKTRISLIGGEIGTTVVTLHGPDDMRVFIVHVVPAP